MTSTAQLDHPPNSHGSAVRDVVAPFAAGTVVVPAPGRNSPQNQ